MATREKPPQPTILKRSTAKRLMYLERRGLIAPIDGRSLTVAHTHRRVRDAVGTVTVKKIDDGSVTGGV